MEPDVPTATEAGHPELAFDGLVGYFGPPGMPMELRERIAADVRAVTDASIESRLITTGQILNLGGPAEFAQSIEQQRARLAAIAKDLGIKPSLARWKLIDKIRETNRLIEAECKAADNVVFVSVEKPMLGEDGKPKESLFAKDGLHLSDEGYKIWASLLQPHLKGS